MLAEQCRRLSLDVEAAAPSAGAADGAKERGAGAGRGNPKAKPRDPAALDISSIHRRVRDLMMARGERAGGEPPTYSGDIPLPAGWEARYLQQQPRSVACCCPRNLQNMLCGSL